MSDTRRCLLDCGELIQENIPLADKTAVGVGGSAEFYVETDSAEKLASALWSAKKCGVTCTVLGGGKNVVINDSGLKGVVIFNKGGKCEIDGYRLICDSGVPLNTLVDLACQNGIAGFSKLAGIPGTVGGAIYGNAGAFGEVIGDVVEKVRVWQDSEEVEIKKENCGFGYRTSVFKNNGQIILSAVFLGEKGDVAELTKEANDTREYRSSRGFYKMRAPGSFFKNILVSELPEDVLADIDEKEIKGGKLPAGYLLDKVGAKGMSGGGAKVSEAHANWIYNSGNATAKDIRALSEKLKEKVRERYGVELEEEVQYIG